MLTDSVRYERGRHETLSRLAVLEAIGVNTAPADATPTFEPGRAARRGIWRRLHEAWRRTPEGPRPRPLVVLHIGAGMSAKRWPAEHWRELACRLIYTYDARVALVGGREDASAAQEVLGKRELPSTLNWVGQLNVVELAALLQVADLFIGADSGPAHLAAAVQTPVVALFSGTNDPRQWKPCGERVAVVRHETQCSPCHRERCPWGDHPCMSQLTPERVMRRLATIDASWGLRIADMGAARDEPRPSNDGVVS